ncbi:hypothetical protein FRB90_007843, partial [Tulasnella sp. 427]
FLNLASTHGTVGDVLDDEDYAGEGENDEGDDSGRGDRSAEWDADRDRLTPAHARRRRVHRPREDDRGEEARTSGSGVGVVDSGRGDRSSEWDADRDRLTPAHAHEDAEFIVRDFNHWDENEPDPPTTTLGRTTMPFASRPMTHSRVSPTSPPAAHATHLDADDPFFVRPMGRRALVSTYPARQHRRLLPYLKCVKSTSGCLLLEYPARAPLSGRTISCLLHRRRSCPPRRSAAPPKLAVPQLQVERRSSVKRPHLSPGRSTDRQTDRTAQKPSRRSSFPTVGCGVLSTFRLIFVLLEDGLTKMHTPGSLWESAPTELWTITSVPISFGLFLAGDPTHYEPITNWAFVRYPYGGLLRPPKPMVVRLIASPTSLMVLIVQFAATCIYDLIGAAG